MAGITCANCGRKQTGLFGSKNFVHQEIDGKNYCEKCARQIIWGKKIKQIVLTTSFSFEGKKITKYLGIISAEVVVGTGLFSELHADFMDAFGKRATSFEKKLEQGKKDTFNKLKALAVQRGADAVIGVDLDYMNTIKNQLVIIANGTAVKLE